MIENKKGLLLVFFTAVVSGFSIFINSFGVKGFDSSVFTFSKNVVVALFLFSIIIFLNQFNELKKLDRRHWLQLAGIGLIGGSIPFLLFFKGLQMATGTAAGFIHKTMFVYAAVFALLFLKEKLTKGLFFGALLLLAGNYFMIRPDFNLSLGIVFIFIATVLWAAENILAKYVLKELSGTVVAFGRMFFGSLFILVFLLATGKAALVFSMSYNQYLWIALTSIFLLLYVFTYYNGLKAVKVTTASCILALGAPITTLLSFVFNGTAISLYEGLGMLLIVLGVISVIWLLQIVSFATNIFTIRQDERN